MNLPFLERILLTLNYVDKTKHTCIYEMMYVCVFVCVCMYVCVYVPAYGAGIRPLNSVAVSVHEKQMSLAHTSQSPTTCETPGVIPILVKIGNSFLPICKTYNNSLPYITPTVCP